MARNRRGGDQPRSGGNERRGGDQPGGGTEAEVRRQTRFKQRKGPNRLPIPPREQTVAATSESALEGRANLQRGGGENE
ncbi:hypothetical protein PCURB6_23280 [Paenibacillus curdlanolyticus]|nr:hypothetical protein [Paenibacillus curdlanolyticus]GFN32068.1 hypothetical protein PCURB6_23280 [Paenibacillus curdlanolyticus]